MAGQRNKLRRAIVSFAYRVGWLLNVDPAWARLYLGESESDAAQYRRLSTLAMCAVTAWGWCIGIWILWAVGVGSRPTTWGRNPWGQQILTHISWDLLWASLLSGVMFLIAHASYMVLSAHRTRSAADMPAFEIERHTFMARMFHWMMSALMFVLLFTAFLPIAGFRFPWVTWHWMAGLALTASIIYHIVHATFWLDFWSIWVGPKDIPEFKAEIMLELGREVPGYLPGKYPLGNKLYHLAIVVVGFAAVITGLLLMPRIRTPLFERDPYYMTDATWGFTYVLHGLAGVGLVGLMIAHIYFAIRPDKWWITKGIILGWVPRPHTVVKPESGTAGTQTARTQE